MTKGDSVLESSLFVFQGKTKSPARGAQGLKEREIRQLLGWWERLRFAILGILGQAKIDRRRAVLPWLLPRIVIRILLLVHIQTDDTGKQSSEEQCEELPTVRRLVLHDGSFPKYRRTLADLLVQANSVHYINSLNVLIGWIYAPGIHKNAIICNDFADSRIRTFQ